MAASILGLVCLKALDPHIVNQRTLSEWLSPLGPYAPLAFVLALGVRPLTLLPGQVFTAFGGVAFGTLMGSAYALIGSFLACALIYVLSRKLGKRLMRRLAGGKFPAIQQAAKRHDFTFALLTCINPLLPTDVMIAAGAASGARFWPTALGVLVGTLPGTFLTAQFGSAIGQGKTVMTLVSVAGLVASLVVGLFVGRKVVKQIQAAPESNPSAQDDDSRPRMSPLASPAPLGLDA
jgi:uncharacterized membrane protein YdjX (TVP38/TMEM64 family)